MHPDIVAQYNYIFLWDEDLGVENFHADKYDSPVHGVTKSILYNSLGIEMVQRKSICT